MPDTKLSTLTAANTECPWCGEPLTPEEIAYPETDGDGEVICDRCYRDKCTFDCCRCGNMEDKRHQQNIGCLLVVGAAQDGMPHRVYRGVYEIVDWPYYGGGMIGDAYLFSQSLRRVSRDVSWFRGNDYPCGHLCRECAEKVRTGKEAKHA